MYNTLLILFLLLSFCSCKNIDTENQRKSQDTTLQEALKETKNLDTLNTLDNVSKSSAKFIYLISNYYAEKDTINEEYQLIKQQQWNALVYHLKEREFYLEPAELDLLDWFDECNGFDMSTLINKKMKVEGSNSPEKKQYIYLSNLDKPIGVVNSHFHTQVSIIPGSPYTFEFGNSKYTLRAEAESSDETINDEFEYNDEGRLNNAVYGYVNYKLYLESNGITQLLNSGSYDNTCLKILFIGDLDNDGKPDFLFDTNTWYEGDEVTLFLSSRASKDELVKNMGASGSYYSC